MIVKNYKYIKLAYTARVLIFLACILTPILLKLGIFVIGICFVISSFIVFGTDACENIVSKELNRRMAKLPVPKNHIFKWKRSSNRLRFYRFIQRNNLDLQHADKIWTTYISYIRIWHNRIFWKNSI